MERIIKRGRELAKGKRIGERRKLARGENWRQERFGNREEKKRRGRELAKRSELANGERISGGDRFRRESK